MNNPRKDNYHHGNLKQALLDTAQQALAAESLDKLSLRGLAKALGVTPAAVYGHFSDKIALLVDLRTLGFSQMTETMKEAMAKLPATCAAEDKMRALGRAYMSFALTNPHLFDILFSWTPEFERVTPDCIEAGAGCEQLLHNTISELLTQEGAAPSEYQAAVASFSAWSLVHGISTLLKTGAVEGAIFCDNWPESFSSRNPESQARVIDHLLTIQVEGLKAAAKRLQP